MAEGGINHFKQMVSSVMLATMATAGPIDESFVGYAAESAVGYMNASWQNAAEAMVISHHGDTTSGLMHESHALWPLAHQALALLIQNFTRNEGHQSTCARNPSS